MRSAVALAIGLALVHPSSARVANGPAAEISEVSTSTSGSAIVNWLGRLFRRKAQITCVQDECVADTTGFLLTRADARKILRLHCSDTLW